MAMVENRKFILIGDNPFHGVSHLSLDRAIQRQDVTDNVEYATEVVIAALREGADGFFFSVDDTTLSMLIKIRGRSENPDLYAIVPYSYQYVRGAIRMGGIPGLAKDFVKQVIRSANIHAFWNGLVGVLTNDLERLFQSYLSYEISRIRSASGKNARLKSVLVHEILTDMALALDMRWLIRAHISLMNRMGIKPGFDTRNFPYLVTKFREWGISLSGLVIAAPFNSLGFQMSPSKEHCESILSEMQGVEIIAFSLLAAGYLDVTNAAQYAKDLPNLSGIAIGSSRTEQAKRTFADVREIFG